MPAESGVDGDELSVRGAGFAPLELEALLSFLSRSLSLPRMLAMEKELCPALGAADACCWPP